jgi:hypothetical protein
VGFTRRCTRGFALNVLVRRCGARRFSRRSGQPALHDVELLGDGLYELGVAQAVGDLDDHVVVRVVAHVRSRSNALDRRCDAAYNTRKHRAKTTKTDAVRHVPVHPTLAAMRAEWRLSGWAAMMGRRPESDDLIVPLPSDAIARRRRRRTGDTFRGHDYSGKKWREHDMPLLGWRYREPYATKSTFITLVIEDGAKPDVIRDRVTHTKAARDAFSGYDRGPHWIEACAEVSKLQLTRRLATSFLLQLANCLNYRKKKVEAAGVEGSAMAARVRSNPVYSTGRLQTRWTRADVTGQSL